MYFFHLRKKLFKAFQIVVRDAYSFNTSAGTSCIGGRSSRSYLQQDTNFISGTHLHGPSAQISQSSSLRLICQTARALGVFFYSSSMRVARLLPGCSTARSLRSRLDNRFSISSKIDTDSDVDECSVSALIWDVLFQDSKSRILNRIDK